jgi:hypothetical protein
MACWACDLLRGAASITSVRQEDMWSIISFLKMWTVSRARYGQARLGTLGLSELGGRPHKLNDILGAGSVWLGVDLTQALPLSSRLLLPLAAHA